MQSLNIKYDPDVDGASPKIISGTFPAHLIEWETGNEYDGSIPHNAVYRIAPEAAEYIGKDFDTGEEVKGAGMVSQSVKGNGIWLCPNPPKGEGWKNRTYVEFAESLGIEFPKTTDPVTGKAIIDIQALELDDVLGLPVLVVIGQQIHKEDKNLSPEENPRKYPRVFKTLAWEDGEPLDLETLLEPDTATKKVDPFAEDDE